MTMPEEPDSPELPTRYPTRELLLAQALDACIRAERREPGSAQAIIAHQPAWARAELQKLLGLAGSLDAAATNAVMSEEFRAAARARLMARIGANATPEVVPLPGPRLSAVPARSGHHRPARTRRTWLWRGCASMFAAVLGVTATLTASASALPGEPLYRIKQAREEIGVRLAADDQARAMALLRAADARLDETGRLLQQGRTEDALVTTQRYDQAVERATTTFIVTIEEAASEAPAAQHMDSSLSQQQEQLQALLQSAPEPARADLREALVATERSRALVADPRPVERALGRSNRGETPMASGKTPPVSAEDVPTAVATRRPAAAQAAPALTAPVAPTSVVSRAIDDAPVAPTSVVSRAIDDALVAPTSVVSRASDEGPPQIRVSGAPRRADDKSAAVPSPAQSTANDQAQSDKTEPSAPVAVQPAFANLISGQTSRSGASQSQATETRASTGDTESVRRAHQDEQVVIVEPTQTQPVAQQPQPVARPQASPPNSAQSDGGRAATVAASRSGGDQAARPATATTQTPAQTDRSTENSGGADAGDSRSVRPTPPTAAKPQSTSTPAVTAQRRGSEDSSAAAPRSSGDARSSKAAPATSVHTGGD